MFGLAPAHLLVLAVFVPACNWCVFLSACVGSLLSDSTEQLEAHAHDSSTRQQTRQQQMMLRRLLLLLLLLCVFHFATCCVMCPLSPRMRASRPC